MSFNETRNEAPRIAGDKELVSALKYPVTALLASPVSWVISIVLLLFASVAHMVVIVLTAAGLSFPEPVMEPVMFVALIASTLILGIFTLLITSWIYTFVEKDRRELASKGGDSGSVFTVAMTLIVYSLLVLIGLLAFVIPGMIIAFLFLLAPSFAARGYGIVESFKRAVWSLKSNPVAVGAIGAALVAFALVMLNAIVGTLFLVMFVIPMFSVLAAHADNYLESLEPRADAVNGDDEYVINRDEWGRPRTTATSPIADDLHDHEHKDVYPDPVFDHELGTDSADFFEAYDEEYGYDVPVFDDGTQKDDTDDSNYVVAPDDEPAAKVDHSKHEVPQNDNESATDESDDIDKTRVIKLDDSDEEEKK